MQKILGIIKKDILNLSARGKLAVLNTCTPIAPDDLAQKLEEDTAWKTTKYPTVISWPVDIRRNPENGLWAEYFRLYDSENAQDKPHKDSLRHYVQHRAEMDEGAEVFQPDRFNPRDGHISGL